jgi:hypothetical protein
MAEVRRRWTGRGITGRPKLLASAAVCPWACLNVLLFPHLPTTLLNPPPLLPSAAGARGGCHGPLWRHLLLRPGRLLCHPAAGGRHPGAPAHAAPPLCCACSCCAGLVLRLPPTVATGSSAPADPLCTLRRLCCFTCLQVPTSQTDCYRVVQPAAVTAAAAAAVSAAPVAAPQGPSAVMQAAMQQLTIGAMDSQQGGLHEAPGSQVGCPAAAQDEACSRASGGTAAVLTLPADCCLGACASCPPSRPCCSAP